jgi:hypothetical protein
LPLTRARLLPELLDELDIPLPVPRSAVEPLVQPGPMRAFFSGNLARARAQLKLAGLIASRHREPPYDLIC